MDVDEGWGRKLRERRSSIKLEIKRWSAWAPGLEDFTSWREWTDGAKRISGPIKPDVSFVDRLLRRRLSPLYRMAFKAASDSLAGQEARPLSIFCSHYGEFSRAFEIERGDYATAFREFLPLAEQGHAISQAKLGFMYTKGTGVPQN